MTYQRITEEEVLAAVSRDEARTVQEVAGLVGKARNLSPWSIRGTVRNRLWDLIEQGRVIENSERPMLVILPDREEPPCPTS
jgi:hypothetical protein